MIKKSLLFFMLGLFACNAFAKSPKVLPAPTILEDTLQKQFIFNYYEALRHKEERNFQLAKDAFKACEKIKPEDPGLLAELSVMYALYDSAALALNYMERAVNAVPDNKWYKSRLIALYAEKKEFDKAVKLAEKLHQDNPYNEDYFNLLITLYKQTEQFAKAIKLYNQLEKITGINEMIAFDKFRLYLALTQPQKANAEIDKLIRKFPYQSKYKVFRADIMMQQKQTEKAFAIYQDVLNTDPSNPDVYLSMSEYYKSIGDEKKSLDFIVLSLKNEALDIDTKLEILGQHIEKLLKRNAEINDTESLFKLLTEKYPFEEKVYNYYGAFLLHQKRNDEAMGTYETSLFINPKNESNWLTVAQLFLAKEKNDSALLTTNKALSSLPDNLNILFFQGLILFQMNQLDEALEVNKKCIQLSDKNTKAEQKSNFYAQIADIYLKMNLNDSAFQYYDQALLYNPGNLHVLNNYAYYLSLDKKDLRKAEKMSATTVEKEPSNSTYLDTYAWIFYQQGNFSLAKFYIERAIDHLGTDTTHAEIYDHYGDILWMNGNNDAKAIQMWQKALDAGLNSDAINNKIKNKGWPR